MPKLLSKILAWTIIAFTALTLLGLLGFNTFVNFSLWKLKEAKSTKSTEGPSVKEELQKKQLQKIDQELDGFTGKDLYIYHDQLDQKEGYLGIKGVVTNPRTRDLTTGKCSPELEEQENPETGYLIFSEEVKQAFEQILQDVNDWFEWDGQLTAEKGMSKDNYSNCLARNNCILYGAPGTGKTEFVRELSRVLLKKCSTLEDDDDPKSRLIPLAPVIEIKGYSLQTVKLDHNDLGPHEKLIKILQKFKAEKLTGWDKETLEKYQEGVACQLPYIVFIEEADQAKNVTTDKEGKGLEEFKNFLSSSTDEKGLNTAIMTEAAQDRNSIIIIATNNYKDLDPAIKRRGRLGKQLNFTWTPETLYEYSQGDPDGNFKVNWPTLEEGSEHPSWKFSGNPDYHLLFALCEKFNFANYKNEFVTKANAIFKQWEEWAEPERNTWAASKLGNETELYCLNCHKTVTPPEPGIKSVSDDKQKETILIKCGEEAEHEAIPICNWLLHFLHTFWVFHAKSNLANWKHPNQILRYTYDKDYLLRETMVRSAKNNTQELRGLKEQLENLNKNAFVELKNIARKLGNS